MAGVSFDNLPRTAVGSTKCPEGTQACPGKAALTPENMICYPAAEHKAKCPITDIIFVKDQRKAPSGYSTAKTFVNGFSIAFSKTATDNLPIQSIRLD
jgi:hypothetical protein